MASTNSGLESRHSRVRDSKSGSWGSSSQDFLYLANMLFEKSVGEAKRANGNCSVYALAGIPLLFSALRCLLIELNAGIYTASAERPLELAKLAKSGNDISFIVEHYPIPVDLRKKLELLLQVRHEITHPAHRPSSERNNTPLYLLPLREAGLLNSTGGEIDYIWIDQLKSHKLFEWAFVTLKATVDVLICEHDVKGLIADGLRLPYDHHK